MNELELLAREAATKYGLDPRLICALCQVESRWNPWAVRHEPRYRWLWALTYEDYPMEPHFQSEELHLPGYTAITEQILQRTSWGLMQIMGAVARERGFRDWLTGLCDPAVNLEWGCRHLRWMELNADSYGIELCADVSTVPTRLCGLPQSLAAAWNGGKARIVDGKYVNEDYVKRVVRAMERYQ